MRFIHLSDLHLGKRLSEFSLLEDQRYILDRILAVVDEEGPDAVIVAGDVYDKTVPPAEAVQLFDGFLYELARRELSVFVISGNHDSPERIAFGGRLMDKSGVFLSPVYGGTVAPVTLEDEHGPLDVWLLPFVKPAHVRRFYPEETIESYTDAVAAAIAHMAIDPARRNILVTHQFVTGAARSDSEEITVGGADNVDAAVFVPFDYVALGHIHCPQSVGRDTIRYCGTPLKYSFSEKDHVKSVTVVDLGPKGGVSVRTAPLVPRRDMREIRGSFRELTGPRRFEGDPEDYLRIVLTDEEDVPDAAARLREVYPHFMKLDYDNARTRASGHIRRAEALERKSGLELFGELYETQNGRPMTEEQRAFAAELFEKIREESL